MADIVARRRITPLSAPPPRLSIEDPIFSDLDWCSRESSRGERLGAARHATPLNELLREARRIRDARTRLVTYSPKVFIPLTKLCRDVCHYEQLEAPIRDNSRTPRQRTTLYGESDPERRAASFGAPPGIEPINPSVRNAGLKAPSRLIRPGFAAAS
jgi:hypothetical protein